MFVILLNMRKTNTIQEDIDIKREKSDSIFKKRIHEVDFLRGLLIVLVLVDHIFWNFYHYNNLWAEHFNYKIDFLNRASKLFNWYWLGDTRAIIREFVLFLFCFISGVSCAFSRSNWKRGAQMVLVALFVSVFTNLVDSWHVIQQVVRIDFNIIAVLSWSTLIYCFFQEKTYKSLLCVIVGTLIFSLYGIPILKSIPGSQNAYVPPLWRPAGQADYIPLFPYIAFFFTGALFSRFFYQDKKSLFPNPSNIEKPICFIGRHTMIIYLSHQLFIIPIFLLINLFIMG